MSKEYSPFTPGVPVPLEFFVGRADEAQELVHRAGAAAQGRLQNVFLSGERGIGKSSLARFARHAAQGRHRVIAPHVFLGGVTTVEEAVRRIFEQLLASSLEKPWHARLAELFGGYIRQVGLFGVTVEFTAPQGELEGLARQFVPALRSVVARLGNDRAGLMVVLDDINGLAAEERFANWLKTIVDEAATGDEPLPLFLVLVGLEERRTSLVRLQPSLARVFDVIEIRTWSDDETKEFFERSFRKVNTFVSPEALALLVEFSGGLPMLAHEIGDATFNADTDEQIDRQDALAGISEAAEVVGRKHLEPRVYDALRSERYRSILRTLGRPPFYPQQSLRRRDLAEGLSPGERKVLDNFLRRMRELGALVPDPEGGRGTYRFANRLYQFYVALEAQRTRGRRTA